MPRRLVVLPLIAAGAVLGSTTALAESYPRPPVCDASTAIPAVSELPAGCALAVFAAQPTSRQFEPAPPPVVFVRTAGGTPVLAETEIASSWTTMRGDITYCASSTCTDVVIDGDIGAIRYDIVFLETPPVGATLEITGSGASREVLVTAAGACPAVVPPVATCELPRCGEPDAHCMSPDLRCDGGIDPYPPRDAGDPFDDDIGRVDRGCAIAGPALASPLVLLALALALRRRRR